jgi:hypothetical protein
VEPFAIAGENIPAAVFLLSGEKDKIWPSTKMSKRIIRRLGENQYMFPFQHFSYDVCMTFGCKARQIFLTFLITISSEHQQISRSSQTMHN